MSAASVSRVSPTTAPVARGFQPVLRSPPSSGRNVSPCASGRLQASDARSSVEDSLEPGVQVAAVGDRAAFDDPPLVEEVREEPRRAAPARPRAATRYAPEVPIISAARSGVDAAGAEVRAGAVAERRVDRPDRLVAERRQQLLDRGRARRAARRPTTRPRRSSSPVPDAVERVRPQLTGQLQEQVVAERDGALRPCQRRRLLGSSHASFAGQ